MPKEIEMCPKCDKRMEQGFCHRASGLHYIHPDKMSNFAFMDEDLVKAGFRKILPSKAEYYLAYLCDECKFYCVDFSHGLDRAEANALTEGNKN